MSAVVVVVVTAPSVWVPADDFGDGLGDSVEDGVQLDLPGAVGGDDGPGQRVENLGHSERRRGPAAGAAGLHPRLTPRQQTQQNVTRPLQRISSSGELRVLI